MTRAKKTPEVIVKPAKMSTFEADAPAAPRAASVTALMVDGSRFPLKSDGGLPGAREAAEEVFRLGFLELGYPHGFDVYPVAQIRRIEVRLT